MTKMGTDLNMTVQHLCQMAYMLFEETEHEGTGAAMFLLFILHYILNWRWHRNLEKSTYTGFRFLQTTVNFLVFACMIGLIQRHNHVKGGICVPAHRGWNGLCKDSSYADRLLGIYR